MADKFYGFGVIDRDGDSLKFSSDSEEQAIREQMMMDVHGSYAPYKVVELFYKEDE